MPTLASLMPVISGGAQVVNGILNRSAAGNATQALQTGADTAINTIQGGSDRAGATLADIYKQQQGVLQPYVDSGHQTLDTLQKGIAPGGGLADPFQWVPADLQNDPIFQRRLKQGMDAINAQSNAGGTRFTSANLQAASNYETGAANDYLAQDYARQENTFRQNQATRLSALQNLEATDTGETNKLVDAGGTYGANLSKLQTGTAEQIAELQTQKANAEASGDVAKANSLTDTINAVAGGVADASALSKLNAAKPLPPYTGAPVGPGDPGFVGPVQPGQAGATLASAATPAATLGGTAAGLTSAGASLASVGAGAVPSLGALPAVSGALPAFSAGGAASALPAVDGTVGAAPAATGALHALLLNPWTVPVAAGVIGVIALLKSQAHWEANTFVKNVQNPFGQNLSKAVDGFDKALASGQLDKATAQQIRDSVAQTLQQFEQARQQFGAKGGDNKEVADNAEREMIKDFGPGYEKILSKMDQEIAGLQ